MKVYCITTTTHIVDEDEVQVFRAVYTDKKRAEEQAQMILDDLAKELLNFFNKSEIVVNDVVSNHGSITNINGDYYEVAITEHLLVGKTE